MLNRVILLLGDTPASVVARQYAFRLIRAEGAEIAGLCGVDLAFIQAPMLGGIGTTAWKVHMEEALKAQAATSRSRLHEAYEKECLANQVPCEWLEFEGDPTQALLRAAESADLLISGHDTAFHGNIREFLPEMIANVLWTAPRPVIVTADADHGDAAVMIAYDGSLPAVRAVQLFALLGIWSRHRMHLVTVQADKAEADGIAQGALRYLRLRGCNVDLIAVATRASPAEVLRIEVADRGIGTLVIGAYGHRGLRERMLGSVTTRLLQEPPCALFVYH